MQPIEFAAPWSRSLRLTTWTTVTLLLVIALIGAIGTVKYSMTWSLVVMASPLVILFSVTPSMVRGYVLTEREIQIKRLGWVTKLPLKTLLAVEGKADAMNGSIRLLGNGGLFSFTGYFWNRQLKRYRAFATDPSRAVILRYADKTIVITPHDPQHFIVRARTLLKTAGFPG